MAKTLVIVESPAKAKTINTYLGSDYIVLASKGHVRDLQPKKGAVNPDNNFEMKYAAIADSATYVNKIIQALSKVDRVILAPDPDREGEAIAWHLCELLKEKNKLKDKIVQRVAFYQINKKAIQEAISQPREISTDLVNSQQARRALDYLIGFYVSPLLWKKIRKGLSAGRVQSPALRLISEREKAIKEFEKQEYWSIFANLTESKQEFQAKLFEYQGEKLKQFSIQNKEHADKALADLEQDSNNILTVASLESKPRKRNPSPPFTTSTLQQEASRKIGFGAAKTMMIAQQLYEGIETNDGHFGAITYMRTDSVTIAKEAITEIRSHIETAYGKEQLPKTINTYKTKAKNAQEAHEAIRPTVATKTPAELAKFMTQDQAKLYDLIWKRTIASQMIYASIMGTRIDLACGTTGLFRVTGSVISNPGFLAVYEEGTDDVSKKNKEATLPSVKVGQEIPLKSIIPEQHFTEPPPRYSEATLVKALEELGIGRPSTYASIIQTLKNREYVELEAKRFHLTDTGEIVNNFLTKYLTKYVDFDFTSQMEDDLDAVAEGEKQWIPILEEFWGPFKELVDKIETDVDRKDVTQEEMDEKCPECSSALSIRLGRRGKFVGCTNYPECKYTRNMDGEVSSNEPEIVPDRKCPTCESNLIYKIGRYGKFIGCSNYPECKHIEPLEKPKATDTSCPKCTKGELIQRRSRRGKYFYSCETYPKCDYAIWNEPINEKCEKCEWPITTLKETKRFGKEIVCPECGDKKPAPEEAE